MGWVLLAEEPASKLTRWRWDASGCATTVGTRRDGGIQGVRRHRVCQARVSVFRYERTAGTIDFCVTKHAPPPRMTRRWEKFSRYWRIIHPWGVTHRDASGRSGGIRARRSGGRRSWLQ
jgi:hypothetical protein